MKNARETAVQALLRQSTENAYSNLVIDALATKNIWMRGTPHSRLRSFTERSSGG